MTEIRIQQPDIIQDYCKFIGISGFRKVEYKYGDQQKLKVEITLNFQTKYKGNAVRNISENIKYDGPEIDNEELLNILNQLMIAKQYEIKKREAGWPE